ncbi:ammonium transporter [Actinomadura sp. DC4]|uniref:ammonium transporter n=1 Tax=Actinomadura sp. DC4 TaxID=3055069 RepID=UPI0025AF9883|nr:ammonium transporter [Actinomadura sp. DC4]MDN3356618.1 ammonium transporter [Actinomadura sp. DC4]
MNSGDTAWLLASSALVLLMTPGLAFFYGGMTRSKSVLNMLMMNFATIGIVSVLWVLYGYSLAFAKDVGNHGFIGGFGRVGLKDTLISASGTSPELAFASFQLMFAIITPALISGAIADRVKFGGWCAFVAIWTTVVYFPVAHWVFFFGDLTTTKDGGFLADHIGALDFAGGTAVHLNAGMAGLAMALVVGKRIGWPKEPMRPHNVPFVLLGAGLLWFGWFGFNAGSALAANGQASVAFMNTQVATAAAALAWVIMEKIRYGKSTALGMASGAVAGLVAITPACASVNPVGAIIVGLIAGALCSVAVGMKSKFGFDDSLDVVGVHAVGGAAGALLIGFLATPTVTGILTPAKGDGPAGLFYGGGLSQLGKQCIGVVMVAVYSFVLTWIIGKVLDKIMGLRITDEDEASGIDLAVHAESAYEFGTSHSASGGGSGILAALKGDNGGQPTGDTKVEAEA